MANKKEAASTEVVPVKEQLPAAEMIDYGADAGDLGFTKDDLAVPFIRILQSNSPQLQRGNAKFVRDARAGDFFNSVTQEHFGGEEGILVLPVHFVRSYTEWRPRESGGGLVRDHGSDESILRQCQRTDKNKLMLPNGNYINEAAHYFVFQLLGDGQYTQGILPFASTQWRKARTWNTVMSGMVTKTPQGMKPLPMFATVWKLTTVAESNDAGDWMGYKITRHGPIHEQPEGRMLYEAARDFRQLVLSGAVQVKHEEDAPATSGGDYANGNARQQTTEKLDDDIPF